MKKGLHYFKRNELASTIVLCLHKSTRKTKTKHSNRLSFFPYFLMGTFLYIEVLQRSTISYLRNANSALQITTMIKLIYLQETPNKVSAALNNDITLEYSSTISRGPWYNLVGSLLDYEVQYAISRNISIKRDIKCIHPSRHRYKHTHTLGN